MNTEVTDIYRKGNETNLGLNIPSDDYQTTFSTQVMIWDVDVAFLFMECFRQHSFMFCNKNALPPNICETFMPH